MTKNIPNVSITKRKAKYFCLIPFLFFLSCENNLKPSFGLHTIYIFFMKWRSYTTKVIFGMVVMLKNREKFIAARRFGVIMTPLSRD